MTDDNSFALICEVTELRTELKDKNFSSWKRVKVIFIEKQGDNYILSKNRYDKANIDVSCYGIIYNIIYEPCNKFIKRLGNDNFQYEYFMIDEKTKIISKVDKETVETFREL
jgi:hypothetical protein